MCVRWEEMGTKLKSQTEHKLSQYACNLSDAKFNCQRSWITMTCWFYPRSPSFSDSDYKFYDKTNYFTVYNFL